VHFLAGEAINVAHLSSRQDWKDILDRLFLIREKAITANRERSFEVMAHFEPAIQEAQRNYALQVIFEVPKDELSLDEFAFELLRTLGTLIESNLQPYVKELYCLLVLAHGENVDEAATAAKDFGDICERLEKILNDTSILTPAAWGVRVNQWRNIAQHHSYSIQGDAIAARYGKSQPQKQIVLTRSELLDLARELVCRVGALRTSRSLVHLNHAGDLQAYLPDTDPSDYGEATALIAAFATQGFRLLDLQSGNGQSLAVLEDAAPSEGYERPVHYSQFIATIADRFPGTSVEIQYFATGHHLWTFAASAEDLERVMKISDPLKELAAIVSFRRVSPEHSREK